MFRWKKKNKEYKTDETPDKSFIAYIIKGNRQVVSREVIASKRFRVEDETYIIRPECIFLKNIDGKFQSVSYYREGNPNPYNFKKDNIGISCEELDRIYSEDFYNIIVKIAPMNKSIYILIMSIVNMMLCLMFMVSLLMMEFLL